MSLSASQNTRRHITRVDILRHGEPVGGSRYRGQIDDPLSDKGWQQMWDAVGKDCHWQSIVTSPLQRCLGFAKVLAKHHALSLRTEPRLREVGFGAWEGKTAEQLRDEDEGQIKRFYADPVAARPQGAESLEGFSLRVSDAFSEILEQNQGNSVLVIAHAGVIRAIIASLLQAPVAAMYRVHVPVASITRVEDNGERPPHLVAHGSLRL